MSTQPLDKTRCLEMVYETIDEMNETLGEQGKLVKSPQTQLFGCSGNLDSIGIVTFIVMLEQNIADKYGYLVTLADEKALSRRISPFLTVESLAEYLVEKLND
jgi:D-alanine--poly(phosphoribitol) ligase subunit 2